MFTIKKAMTGLAVCIYSRRYIAIWGVVGKSVVLTLMPQTPILLPIIPACYIEHLLIMGKP